MPWWPRRSGYVLGGHLLLALDDFPSMTSVSDETGDPPSVPDFPPTLRSVALYLTHRTIADALFILRLHGRKAAIRWLADQRVLIRSKLPVGDMAAMSPDEVAEARRELAWAERLLDRAERAVELARK